MPANCRCVTRPGVFGNPFTLDEAHGGSRRAVLYFRECLERAMNGQPFPASPTGGSLSNEVIVHFERMAKRIGELRNKDLSCFCPLDRDCHADVLLELANR
jgi:hypothetical protein